MSHRPDPPVVPWMKWTLTLAAAYNLAWGAWVILWPHVLFGLAAMELPRYTMIWQCVGMLVACFGVGYAIASTNPIRWWAFVLVGLIGKIAGPLGFVQAAVTGDLPWRFGWTILANDVIWWLPFFLILRAAYRHDQTASDEQASQAPTAPPPPPPGFPGPPA